MTEATTTAYRTPQGIKYRNRERFIADCEAVEGNEFEVVFKKRKKVRGLQANKYLWACIVTPIHAAMREQGHDVSKQDVWEFLKHRFNYTEILDETTGEILRLPKTTTNLSSTEFATFIEDCIRFASEFLGIAIDPPNTQTEISY